MAIKFETITNPPPKPAEKRAAAAPAPVEGTEAGETAEKGKTSARKMKSRNNLKKK